jgi:Icc-related predicted phosphoesterase
VRIAFTADLHGSRELWEGFLLLARESGAGAAIVGGDLTPKTGSFLETVGHQRRFLEETLRALLDGHRSAGGPPIYAMFGNDDWAANLPAFEALAETGLVRPIHGRRWDISGGLELIGYAHVPPTPFSIKDFERRDLTADPARLSPRAAYRSNGEPAPIDELHYFQELPSIEEELAALPPPRDAACAIYAVHTPPYGTALDVLYDGSHVGSRALRLFLEERRPLLSLHGHIHESPRMSGRWLDRIGRTVAINPGRGERLQAVTLETDDPEGSARHTVWGKA